MSEYQNRCSGHDLVFVGPTKREALCVDCQKKGAHEILDTEIEKLKARVCELTNLLHDTAALIELGRDCDEAWLGLALEQISREALNKG